jgi:hypothetical protein
MLFLPVLLFLLFASLVAVGLTYLLPVYLLALVIGYRWPRLWDAAPKRTFAGSLVGVAVVWALVFWRS